MLNTEEVRMSIERRGRDGLVWELSEWPKDELSCECARADEWCRAAPRFWDWALAAGAMAFLLVAFGGALLQANDVAHPDRGSIAGLVVAIAAGTPVLILRWRHCSAEEDVRTTYRDLLSRAARGDKGESPKARERRLLIEATPANNTLTSEDA